MSHLLDLRQISAVGAEMGYCSLSPDQILMLAEEATEAESVARRCECVSSILQAVTSQALTIEEVRNRVAGIAVHVLPELLIKQTIWHDRAELNRLRSTVILPFLWDEVAGPQLLRFITANGWESREVGKRALFLLYGTQPDRSLRPAMARSFATLGRAIGLKAKNPRSAISASIDAMLGQLLRTTQRRDQPISKGKYWFNKNQACRDKLAVSMKGKKNRAKKREGAG